MRNIFTKILYHLEKKEDLVLVTIVADAGSTPRGKGSMMLVGPEGYITGSVGGGAVEDAAMKRAAICLQEKRSGLEEYDLSQRSRVLGMACGGEVTVSFQYMAAENAGWSKLTADFLKILSSGGSGFLQIDTKHDLMKIVCGENQEGTSFEGTATYIPFEAEERAIVFGGGHIALALVPILKTCNFHVTVMDNRPEYVTEARFPDADQLICGDYTKISRYITLDGGDYLVIMTSGHSHDFEIQEQVLRRKQAYIGVVGSKKKTAAVNAKLKEYGLTEEQISQVHTPIGLDIKAITPAEIAVSIAAEMILKRAKNREKKGITAEKGCPMH